MEVERKESNSHQLLTIRTRHMLTFQLLVSMDSIVSVSATMSLWQESLLKFKVSQGVHVIYPRARTNQHDISKELGDQINSCSFTRESGSIRGVE